MVREQEAENFMEFFPNMGDSDAGTLRATQYGTRQRKRLALSGLVMVGDFFSLLWGERVGGLPAQ